jgi:hypothetical protein
MVNFLAFGPVRARSSCLDGQIFFPIMDTWMLTETYRTSDHRLNGEKASGSKGVLPWSCNLARWLWKSPVNSTLGNWAFIFSAVHYDFQSPVLFSSGTLLNYYFEKLF